MNTRGNRDEAVSQALYRGIDRRRAALAEHPVRQVSLGVAAALLLVTWAVATSVTALSPIQLDTPLVQGLLEMAGATLAAVVGLLCIVRWRLSGENPVLWLGVAMLLFGAVTIGIATLVPLVEPRAMEIPELDYLRAASRVTVMLLVVTASRSPTVDSTVGVVKVVGIALLGVVGLSLLLQLAPALLPLIAGASETTSSTSGLSTAFLVPPAWFATGAAGLVFALRWRRPLLAWFALVAAGLGMAEITRLVAAQAGLEWSASAELVRLAALGCGLAGAMLELQRGFVEQRGTLLESRVHALATEARIRAERALLEERAHDARNALAAIDGATRTLEHYRNQLPRETRDELARAVSAEITRLQRLISAEQISEEATDFVVAEALAPVITGARTQGLAVEVDIPAGLVAHGRWADTAEVVQNLLTNARNYADGSSVRLRATVVDDAVEVRVEDRGPGILAEERERIFSRGGRGAASGSTAGSGLGLYVSAQLMRDQDGHLRVEDRPGGGAAFVARLPAAGNGVSAEAVDEVEQ